MTPTREMVTRDEDGGLHPLPGLPDGGIGKADDDKTLLTAAGDVGLDLHRPWLDTHQCSRGHRSEHGGHRMTTVGRV